MSGEPTNATVRSAEDAKVTATASPAPAERAAREAEKCTVEFLVTGFGPFHGIQRNPTEQLIGVLDKVMEGAMPQNATISASQVVEVSTVGVAEALSSLAPRTPPSEKHHCVWLHYGVSGEAKSIHLEKQAFNEATFRCPDERGLVLQNSCILSDEQPVMKTTLDVPLLVKQLSAKGHKVAESEDAGRFLCNWIYFQSLCRGAGSATSHALFVHVPPHDTVSFEEQQAFTRDLISAITGNLSGK